MTGEICSVTYSACLPLRCNDDAVGFHAEEVSAWLFLCDDIGTDACVMKSCRATRAAVILRRAVIMMPLGRYALLSDVIGARRSTASSHDFTIAAIACSMHRRATRTSMAMVMRPSALDYHFTHFADKLCCEYALHHISACLLSPCMRKPKCTGGI